MSTAGVNNERATSTASLQSPAFSFTPAVVQAKEKEELEAKKKKQERDEKDGILSRKHVFEINRLQSTITEIANSGRRTCDGTIEADHGVTQPHQGLEQPHYGAKQPHHGL